jgi:hypothetical protein
MDFDGILGKHLIIFNIGRCFVGERLEKAEGANRNR